jgi:hypothetical protein
MKNRMGSLKKIGKIRPLSYPGSANGLKHQAKWREFSESSGWKKHGSCTENTRYDSGKCHPFLRIPAT